MRGIPILTFINKLDHFGRDPLELMDEIERALGIATAPINWPIGMGSKFQHIYDLQHRRVLQFERTERGQWRAPVAVEKPGRPIASCALGRNAQW